MPPRLDTLAKGHEFPATTFELSAEWVREYVAAVEDEAIGSLGADLVPPMAVVALAVRALLERASLPAGAVHIGQEIVYRRAARVGEKLSAAARILSRGERQGWLLMGIDLSVNGEGGPVMEGRATLTMPAEGETS
jgi:hypothetical protein